MDPKIFIKRASAQHIPSINAILTHYALNTVITFATAGITDSDFSDKFHSITEENKLPFFVAVLSHSSATPAETGIQENGVEADSEDVVLGYTSISPFRPERPAYIHTGELSLFVHPEHLYKGIGSKLLKEVLEACKETRIRELLAVMAVDVEGKGMGLGLRDYYVGWGFREVGKMERVGRKFDRWVDVIFLQLHIDGLHSGDAQAEAQISDSPLS